MQKTILLFMVIAVLSLSVFAQQGADKTVALGIVNKLFDKMAAADPQGMPPPRRASRTRGSRRRRRSGAGGRSARLAGIRKMKDGKMRLDMIGRDTFSKFFTDKAAVIRETMYAPKVEVDGDWAMVWGRYVFFVGDKLSHCGINQFNLVRTEAGWKLDNGASTIDPGGCTEKEKAMKSGAPAISKEKSK